MKKSSEQVNPLILLGANFPNVCQLLCCCYLYREPSISLLYWPYLGSIYQVYTMYIFMFFTKKTAPLEVGNQKNPLMYLSLCSSTLSGHPPPSRHHKILRSGAKRMLKATHHQVKDALKALDIDQYINQAYGGELPGVISSTASKTFSQRSLRSPWPST